MRAAQPGASVEARQRGGRLYSQFALARSTIRAEAVLDGIVGSAQPLDPVLKHLYVTQLSESGKHCLAGFAHLPPGGIGIDGTKPLGHGAATPQRNP